MSLEGSGEEVREDIISHPGNHVYTDTESSGRHRGVGCCSARGDARVGRRRVEACDGKALDKQPDVDRDIPVNQQGSGVHPVPSPR